MGLILDTSVLIHAERRGWDVDQMLANFPGVHTEFTALCAMSLMELAYGTLRLRSEASRRQAEAFLQDLRAAIPVIPITDEVAVQAGRLDGLLRQSGLTIGVINVVIAATALRLDYGVLTLNPKHFNLVPGLHVVEL